jgi:hypothetical protein
VFEKIETGFRLGKNKVEVLETVGEALCGEHLYRIVRVRISTGKEYLSVRLYHHQAGVNRFLKQLMMEDPAAAVIAGFITDYYRRK